MKSPNYNDSINSPSFDYAKIDTNIIKFNGQKSKGDKIGASQLGGAKIMGRLYLRQLNHLRHVRELDPESVPGFTTHIGGLAKIMDCTRKTVQNRLNHYEKCGAIIRRENNGKNGITIWFHPDIIFKNQDGYAHFTGSQKTYSASQTEPPKIPEGNTSATGSLDLTPEEAREIVQNALKNPDLLTDSPPAKSVNFTHNSSRTTGTVKNNTTAVNKLINTCSDHQEGVLQKQKDSADIDTPEVFEEQNVLPVPSCVGKGEDTGTPTGTRESRPKKIESKGKSRQIRAPKNAASELPIPEKDGKGGAGRAFLMQRVVAFWEYAKKMLYPDIILEPSENKEILNLIWASVFLKFPPGHSEDDWWNFYKRVCIRVDKVVSWLEINPAFELPPPHWYFSPGNKSVAFSKTEEWLVKDERRAVMNKIKKEVNDYAQNKGRYRQKTPIWLFRRHERLVAMRKDVDLSAMFGNMKATLYGNLKVKEKF